MIVILNEKVTRVNISGNIITNKIGRTYESSCTNINNNFSVYINKGL
jgi:hypothetical protein